MAIVSNLFILIESPSLNGFSHAFTRVLHCDCFPVSKIFGEETSVAYSGLSDIIRKNRGLLFLFSVVLVLFSVKTFSRNLDWKSNFTLLQRDVKTNPNSARIQYSLGSTYVFELMEKEKDLQRKRELLQEGVKHLQRGTQLLPFYGDAWFNMGFAYNQLEDYPNAATCFVKGFEYTKKPTQEQYIGAGIAYGKNGDYKKAVPMFRTVLAKNDTSFDAYNNLGMFQSTAGQYDSAIINLKKAIEVKPGGSEAYYNMGNVYAYRQNFSSAIDWYKQALERDPHYILALGNMANCYAALKEYDTALKCIRKF
jgi:tetratricopeptide (TPR) repeat protein